MADFKDLQEAQFSTDIAMERSEDKGEHGLLAIALAIREASIRLEVALREAHGIVKRNSGVGDKRFG